MRKKHFVKSPQTWKGRTTIMSSERANMSIECTINNCKNHCCDCNYCSLDKIKVGTHECNPTKKPCTDCLSFELK